MNKIEQAVQWLKKGGLIIVADDEDREAEGDLIGLADYATAESINFMATHGRGLICAPISEKIAQQFKLSEMVEQNTDSFQTAFTISIDHISTHTGISAIERAQTIQALANHATQPTDFHRPGHVFPLIAKPGGVRFRRGHTEAAIDLAKLAQATEAAYICEILSADGTMARKAELQQLAKEWELPLITIDELVHYLQNTLIKVSLPSKVGEFTLQLFEDEEHREHLALSKGLEQESTDPILVRVHSECLTGDVFGSLRCDCGEQLQLAMEKIEQAGRGVLLYLRQEGRGIGLKNKLRAYQLQEAGMDTYEANIALGFLPDERTYSFAATMLNEIGVTRIQLMTNNPDKVHELEKMGIQVDQRIPLQVNPHPHNHHYLVTKKEKFHHELTIH
ncbi:3,4-dihydroxy-2-butanone-4-phosphate synthase [Enterococcus sp. AZ150]|uniref:GTP cyclohydrolase-2 n=1 Tax=Enterococcus sulfureus ATCC 49903 TaxID=1140003 RepID=S0P6A2_9ENTE|nr:bifunctional 3,4-dihydroxy-2-butanone-4-phosphate synthase/GTP cyclohydrolase II [Enterococcus sulfureus]EOT47608.1 3,4-dihydroxy-2-butanone-4-phosphate synthase [Enterococcus sulfureus ATCC 49903]EOT83971.1 3,4-dihydroxy-2-butanone-4-phosphate synthase [Enterococcus sulfureus ATCC 49903]